MMTRKLFGFLFAGLCAAILFTPSVEGAGKKLKVTATVTMVADMVRDVGGDRVTVQALMGPGVDPHLYKATASDLIKIQEADVIFYSGLVLEGKMQDVYTRMVRSKKHLYGVTEAIPPERLLEPAEFEGHYDPHVWFEVPLWELCIQTVVQGLSEADPDGKTFYEKNGAAARAKYKALHQRALKKVAELPKEKRILVTSHNAYNYFGRAYGFASWDCRVFRPSRKTVLPTWPSSWTSSVRIR